MENPLQGGNLIFTLWATFNRMDFEVSLMFVDNTLINFGWGDRMNDME